MESGGPSQRTVAKQTESGVSEIIADNPDNLGILATASTALAQNVISIRLALVDDTELNPDPRPTPIRGRALSGKAIPLILKIPGVAKVSAYLLPGLLLLLKVTFIARLCYLG